MKWHLVCSAILVAGLIPSTLAQGQDHPGTVHLKSESAAYQALLQKKSDIEVSLQRLYKLVTATHPKVVLGKERLKAIEEEINFIDGHEIQVEKLDEEFASLAIQRAFVKADLRTLQRDFTWAHPVVVSKRHELDCLTNKLTAVELAFRRVQTPSRYGAQWGHMPPL